MCCPVGEVFEWAFVTFLLNSYSFLLDESCNQARVYGGSSFDVGEMGNPSVCQGVCVLMQVSLLILYSWYRA